MGCVPAVCVLPGYIFQLAIRGADAVKPIPDAIRGLFPADGTARTRARGSSTPMTSRSPITANTAGYLCSAALDSVMN
jgi:hypothetical protein